MHSLYNVQIAYEMELINQTDDMQDSFELEWDRYVRIILRYAFSHENPSKDLRHALGNLESVVEDDGKSISVCIHVCVNPCSWCVLKREVALVYSCTWVTV